jgi:putative ABC transport system permease protein
MWTLWKYTIREGQRRPGRTCLTLGGIVIGVATVVAIALTTRTTQNAYRDMFDSLGGRAALEVVSETLSAFDRQVAEQLSKAPGVRDALPVVQNPAVLTTTDGPQTVLLLGVDPQRDRAARPYEVREGRGLSVEDGALLLAGFARRHGLQVGQRLPLLTLSGLHTIRVAGIADGKSMATFNGGAVVLLPLGEAQALLGIPAGGINSVQLVLDDAADPRAVREGLALPAGLTVQAPGARGALAQDSLFSAEQGLATISVVSLVAGAFVILNSFLMNLNERRRQLAILRSLGATRRQVTRLLLREAVLLGLLGAALGGVAGLGLSVVLRGAMEGLVGLPLPPLSLSWQPFLLGLLLGPGMAVLATIFPAWRAARRPPLEELLARREAHSGRLPQWTSRVGLALLALSLLYELAVVSEWLPWGVSQPFMPAAMAIILTGAVLALPLFFDPLLRGVKWLLRPLLGLEGRLALRHLERHRGRTTLTVAVLFIAVGTTVGFGQALRNNIDDAYRWYERTILADFLVRGAMPDRSLILPSAVPESLRPKLAALPGVGHVDMVHFVHGRTEGRPVLVLARTFDEGHPLRLDLREDEGAIRTGLAEGGVVLGVSLAQSMRRGVGDTITLETPHGPRPLKVAGTVNEYTVGGMALYMEWHQAQRLLDFRGAHAFEVAVRPAQEEEAGAGLRRFCADEGLLLQTNRELRDIIDEAMQGVAGFLWVVIALILVVASLGILNTLTMNVLEQTRELGVLRAIGMKRGQVGRLIVAQALAVGVLSLLPGVALGVLLTYLMNLASAALIGHAVPFRLEGNFVLGCAVVALATALAASLWPARRAARLPVIRALQYE